MAVALHRMSCVLSGINTNVIKFLVIYSFELLCFLVLTIAGHSRPQIVQAEILCYLLYL